MVIFDYFDDLGTGMEFLIALGSILGMLGLVVGFIVFIWGGGRLKKQMLGVIIFSIALLAICGLDTGVNYFHIFR
ncbi:MAG: hypothetical protein KGD66_08680 [Candidatus Lokiarchaeota archaeon]|nr:hypothetical protein [Candidatus Lokiarchaeota archaeon]